MPSRPVTPESLGPEILLHLEGTIPRAERNEGTAELGPIAEKLTEYYRALAICLLSDDLDVDGFFVWLLHAPVTWRHYLVSVGSKGLGEPEYLAASKVDPLLDAMAARQWKLAARLASLSSPTWLEGVEYEDDFCYGDFLRRVVTGAGTGMEGLLDRWQKVLEGGADPRLEVARAFHARDAAAFEEALRGLLDATEKKAMEMSDPISGTPRASDPPFMPNRWVSIEGLALLAAAERAGIPVDFELERCPRAARTGEYAAFQPRGYPNQGLD
jgi:hypothetical protein